MWRKRETDSLRATSRRVKRTGDVGLNYRGRLVDAAVDVRFGGEMDNGIATTHRCFYGRRVANVAF